MKPLCTMIALSIGLLLSGCLDAAEPGESSFIQKIPALRAEAYRAAKVEWDSGVTSRMVAGSVAYNEALIRICEQLAARHYPENHFGPAGIRSLLEQHIASLTDLSWRINDVYGDGGGTLNQVQVMAAGTEFLEKTIEQMVMAVT